VKIPRPALPPGWKWLALFGFALAATLAYVVVPHSRTAGAGIFDGIVLLGVFAAGAGWHQSSGRERSAWFWAIASLAGFLAGELVWLRAPNAGLGPFHSAGNTIFTASCLPLAVAAVLLVAARERDGDRSAWLEAGVVTAAVGVVTWDVLIAHYFRGPHLSTTAQIVGVAPPAANVLALGLVMRFVMSRRAHDWSSVAFATGATLMLVANLLLYRDTTGAGFQPGKKLDGLLLLSCLLVGFAAPHLPWKRRSRPRRETLGRARFSLVLIAVFVPDVMLARGLDHRHLDGLNTLTVATCMSMLVIALAATSLVRLFRRVREAEVHRGEARLSALILHSADAIFLIDEEYRISFTSPSGEVLCGRNAGTLNGASFLDAFVEEHQGAVAHQLKNLATMAPGATVPLEGHAPGNGRQVRMLEGTGQNLLEDENIRAIVITLRDTTSQHELEQQLERRAFHDDLTGLANRALFAERLAHAVKRNGRESADRFAVLFIDLDDFKAVNDGMGHGAGDELIRGVADRIRASVRPADTVARLGGDEFAVLLEDTASLEVATTLAERLLETLQLPIDVLGVGLAVPASVGVTFATKDSTAETLLRDADIAMYSAKSQGKGRVAVFDTRLHDVAVRRLALKVELPEALRSDQFRVAYQPIRRIADQSLCGFEALVRWHHPKRGLISPGEFIPAAENTGLIVELGRWVLGKACEEAVFWNRRSPEPLFISVNVSGLQLHRPGFVEDMSKILETTGLDPKLLNLELTESILVKNQRVEGILDELRTIGVGIAIDDFGTGYSSLSYLQDFPATSIKVDRSFVNALVDRGEVGLVRSIISIADALGLTTLAEGVETLEQLDVLRSLGCDLAQGFLLGRPQAEGEITGMLEIERMSRTVSRMPPISMRAIAAAAASEGLRYERDED